MKTTREERADLRARCKAGVIAITTDAGTVAALIDDVEESAALAVDVARWWASADAEVSKLRAELAEARETVRLLSEQVDGEYAALRAHARKVTP